MFRYTTKISEYLAARLPVVTGRLPLAYDLDGGWLWRLPGHSPWDPKYHEALAALMERMTPCELNARRSAVPSELAEFDRERQVERTTAFLLDILNERKAVSGPRIEAEITGSRRDQPDHQGASV
jgi:hypothetical protein